MDSDQIFDIMTKYGSSREFLGVFARDNIPLKSIHYPCAFIVNTMPHTHEGEHWVAVYKNDENIGCFFDSFGMNPRHEEFLDCMSFCKDWDYNSTAFQSPFTTVCGQYCIFFLLHKMNGYSLLDISQFLEHNEFESGDMLVHQFVDSLDPDVDKQPLISYPFIFKQISNIMT